MRIKTFVLGGAAAISLAGAMAVATPVFAQYAGNPPQVSTPAERAKTQELNDSAQSGTTASPAVLNGEQQTQPTDAQYQSQGQPQQYQDQDGDQDQDDQGPPPNNGNYGPPNGQGQGYGPQGNGNYGPQDQDDQNDAQQRYQDQQSQYQDQREQYQAQQDHYQDQRDAYQARRAQYDHDIRRFDIARYEWRDYPGRVYAYHYGDARGLKRLYLIAEPSQQLAFAPVEGPGGHWIGKVRNVEIGVDGRPRRVEIALNRRVSVWVSPENLRFDPYDHVVFTNLSREDVWGMPGAVEATDIYEP